MGLRIPLLPPTPSRVFQLKRPPQSPSPKWRHRAHDLLIEVMMLAGIAAIVYGFVIHPILRRLH